MEFKSKVDKWFYGVMIITALVPILLAAYSVVSNSFFTLPSVIFTLFAVLFLAIDLLILLPASKAKFYIKEDELCIKCGIFMTIDIPFKNILYVKKTRDFIASTATSINRVEITYTNAEGKPNYLQISPDNRDVFVEMLENKVN